MIKVRFFVKMIHEGGVPYLGNALFTLSRYMSQSTTVQCVVFFLWNHVESSSLILNLFFQEMIKPFIGEQVRKEYLTTFCLSLSLRWRVKTKMRTSWRRCLLMKVKSLTLPIWSISSRLQPSRRKILKLQRYLSNCNYIATLVELPESYMNGKG